MRLVIASILCAFFLSCSQSLDTQSLRTGRFVTTLEASDEISTAVRNDSIQIETYKGKKDTFYIKWISNFEYVLTKTHPKKGLDSLPFHVRITGVKDSTYTFRAYYKGSNFKQKGKAIKLKD